MRIAFITSEVSPFSTTGGLGDVLGALPPVLASRDEVRIITPLYRRCRAASPRPRALELPIPLRLGNRPARFADAALPGRDLSVTFVEQDDYFDRPELYGPAGGDYHDNCERFVFFCRAALELLAAENWRPDVIHVHDWQTSLIPVYLKTLYATRFPRTRSVLTIHNLAFQGVFWHWDLPLTGLDWSLFNWRQLEFHGRINLLKGGLVFADAITTVSPTYAREIQTPDRGCGLEGVLRERREDLVGILNGIDAERWDPASDPELAARYSADNLSGKAACRRRLLESGGLPDGNAPVVGYVGRLATQKGVDLLLAALDEICARDLRLIVLGAGEPAFEDQFLRAAATNPHRLSAQLGYDPRLARDIYAGADFLLMPSRFEPCGLSQMYAMRYGTLPIVNPTGGLADTVQDGRTGLHLRDYTARGLVDAVDRAMELHAAPDRLTRLRRAAMAQDLGWPRSAAEYRRLYASLTTPVRRPVSAR